MERKELTVNKVISYKVHLQVIEVDGVYDVTIFPDDIDLNYVRIKQSGKKEEGIVEALKQFEEINCVKVS